MGGCVTSNPTSPLRTHTHTHYTNPRTLIKGILEHNRDMELTVIISRGIWPKDVFVLVCVCLWICDDLHASMTKKCNYMHEGVYLYFHVFLCEHAKGQHHVLSVGA